MFAGKPLLWGTLQLCMAIYWSQLVINGIIRSIFMGIFQYLKLVFRAITVPSCSLPPHLLPKQIAMRFHPTVRRIPAPQWCRPAREPQRSNVWELPAATSKAWDIRLRKQQPKSAENELLQRSQKSAKKKNQRKRLWGGKRLKLNALPEFDDCLQNSYADSYSYGPLPVMFVTKSPHLRYV